MSFKTLIWDLLYGCSSAVKGSTEDTRQHNPPFSYPNCSFAEYPPNPKH